MSSGSALGSNAAKTTPVLRTGFLLTALTRGGCADGPAGGDEEAKELGQYLQYLQQRVGDVEAEARRRGVAIAPDATAQSGREGGGGPAGLVHSRGPFTSSVLFDLARPGGDLGGSRGEPRSRRRRTPAGARSRWSGSSGGRASRKFRLDEFGVPKVTPALLRGEADDEYREEETNEFVRRFTSRVRGRCGPRPHALV